MTLLRLEDVTLVENDEGAILQGHVEGNRLYFKAPRSLQLTCSANPFLAAMLVPAMQRGVDIEIPNNYPVSNQLLSGIDELQSILRFWYPELSRISIHARQTDDDTTGTGTTLSGSLFSGGLDACHTALKHANELTHLIYVRGIDLQLDNEEIFQTVAKCNQGIADYLGKELVVVESNIRFFMSELESSPLGWYINQAGGLASVCLALKMSRIFIGSSNSFDALHPLGTHPLTDPMWSTETTQIIHTGCEMRRHEKLEEIAKHDALLQRIRVCWHDSDFNCGVCDKCVHYRVALTILGLETESMPRLDGYKNLYGAHVNTQGEYIEWLDNLLLAQKHVDAAAAKAVLKLLNRYKIKKAIKSLDDAITGGRLLSLKSAFKA